MDLQEYADWYESRSRRWRLWNLIRWRLDHLRVAMFGGISHGERLLLMVMRREHDERQQALIAAGRRDD